MTNFEAWHLVQQIKSHTADLRDMSSVVRFRQTTHNHVRVSNRLNSEPFSTSLKRLARNSVFEMTHFVSSGTLNLDSVDQSINQLSQPDISSSTHDTISSKLPPIVRHSDADHQTMTFCNRIPTDLIIFFSSEQSTAIGRSLANWVASQRTTQFAEASTNHSALRWYEVR